MNLLSTHVRTFLAVIEQGSMTNAADELGVGKSAVSDSLRQLEEALGARLVARTTRRQHLTSIGQQFYRQCRELSHISAIALEEVSEHLSEPMGIIRITAPNAIIDEKVAPAIAELVNRYPKVQPELIVSDERLDLLEDKIDLAVTVGELKDSEFKAQRVGSLNDILCVSARFLTQHQYSIAETTNLSDVQNWPYIAHHWENADIQHQLIQPHLNKKTIVKFQRVMTSNTAHSVLSLVRQGAGVALLPSFFVKDHLRAGELVPVLPDYEPRKTGIYAVHPYGKLAPLTVRTMIEVMREKI